MIGDYVGAGAILVMVALAVGFAFHTRDAHRLHGELASLEEALEETEALVESAVEDLRSQPPAGYTYAGLYPAPNPSTYAAPFPAPYPAPHLGPYVHPETQPPAAEDGFQEAPSDHDSDEPSDRRSHRRLIVAAAVTATLLMVAAIAVAAIIFIHDDRSASTHRPPVRRASIVVKVLNATTPHDLAARTETRLRSLGFPKGTVGDATGPKRAITLVAYFPRNARQGLAVASALHLNSDRVQALGRRSQLALCPRKKPCTINVVLVLGSDFSLQNKHA